LVSEPWGVFKFRRKKKRESRQKAARLSSEGSGPTLAAKAGGRHSQKDGTFSKEKQGK